MTRVPTPPSKSSKAKDAKKKAAAVDNGKVAKKRSGKAKNPAAHVAWTPSLFPSLLRSVNARSTLNGGAIAPEVLAPAAIITKDTPAAVLGPSRPSALAELHLSFDSINRVFKRIADLGVSGGSVATLQATGTASFLVTTVSVNVAVKEAQHDHHAAAQSPKKNSSKKSKQQQRGAGAPPQLLRLEVGLVVRQEGTGEGGGIEWSLPKPHVDVTRTEHDVPLAVFEFAVGGEQDIRHHSLSTRVRAPTPMRSDARLQLRLSSIDGTPVAAGTPELAVTGAISGGFIGAPVYYDQVGCTARRRTGPSLLEELGVAPGTALPAPQPAAAGRIANDDDDVPPALVGAEYGGPDVGMYRKCTAAAADDDPSRASPAHTAAAAPTTAAFRPGESDES